MLLCRVVVVKSYGGRDNATRGRACTAATNVQLYTFRAWKYSGRVYGDPSSKLGRFARRG